jgi:hypothetical protein
VKKIVFATAAALLLSAPAWAERFALTGTPGAAYYAVTLGPDVYAHSRDAGLADLRILNGDGEPVPFTIDAPHDAPPQTRTLQDVRWFATPADDTQKPGAAGVVLGPDGVLRATGTSPAQESVRAWLLDLSQLHDTVSAVVVGLPAGDFQGSVLVQASQDLQAWHGAGNATLFHLTNQGNTLTQERVELTGLRAKYLRLTWQGKPPVPQSVRVELAAGAPAQPADSGIQWRSGLQPVQTPAAGDYRFDTGGNFPVERVRVRLPQANTVAQESAVITVPATGERYWRLQVDTRSGGLGAGAPELAVGWRPATVTYAARGNVPFALAVGEVANGSPVVRADLLAGASPVVATAQLGTATASPPEAMKNEPPGGTTRQWVLWGALIAAVAVLGGMAWRLFRASGTPADTH